MNYATTADMVARYGSAELEQLTDFTHIPPSQIDEARMQIKLGDAQALVDSYVGQAWRLPLTGCPQPPAEPGAAPVYVPPPLLTRLTCDVARYYLHDDLAPENEVYRRFKAAQAQLAGIADGSVMLACPWGGLPGVQTGVDASGESETLYHFAPRQITDDGLKGFA